MPAERDRIATLRQAAAAKRDAAVARAETGIRALTNLHAVTIWTKALSDRT